MNSSHSDISPNTTLTAKMVHFLSFIDSLIKKLLGNGSLGHLWLSASQSTMKLFPVVPRRDLCFIFFDLETTGCSGTGSIHADTNRILSVAVRFQDEVCEWRCSPGIHIPEASSSIHGITQTSLDTDGAHDSFGEVYPKLVQWIQERCAGYQPVLIAHNAHGFDYPVLRRECARFGKSIPSDWQFYDTLLTYRKYFVERKSKRLGDLYQEAFDKEFQGAHNASADTGALQELFISEIQHLLQEEDLFRSTQYLPDGACLIEIKGIGPKSFRKLVPIIEGSTVGHLRRYVEMNNDGGLKNYAGIETFIRETIGAFRENLIFSILCQIVQPKEPIHEVFARSPFREHGFSVAPSKSSMNFLSKAAEEGIRSPDQLTRFFIYTLNSNPTALNRWLEKLECPENLSKRLTRALYTKPYSQESLSVITETVPSK